MHWLSEHQPAAADQPAVAQGPENAEGFITCHVEYALSPCGWLTMRWDIDATQALPATLAPGLHK
jgi:hypothetical protein